MGEVCWLAKPNCKLLGRLEGAPLGKPPEVPAEVMVTEGLREWSPCCCCCWEAGAPLTMVTPGEVEEVVFVCCCMGLPLTEDAEVDCPCCEEPPTVTGAAVESVADFLVALA